MLAPGTTLSHYRILAPLGAGGMAEVYRAHDSRLGRDVALKVLPAEMASCPERLARFEREARTVAGLNHPNIVTLYSIEHERELRFLTMELVEGRSLREALESGRLPIARVVAVGIELADALASAHEQGVVHRDLKPANVMLTRHGRVKVLDFGLAKLAEPPSDPALSIAATLAEPPSVEGLLVGTVPYMAPEQVRGGVVDSRTDLFALGIVLYELAAGTRPFTGATPADTLSMILRDEPEPLCRARADTPAALERIVFRCLEKDPRQRFASAQELAEELRRLQQTLGRAEPAQTEAPVAAPIASVAVLPFVNRGASVDDEYFSDGLADEVLNMLTRIRGLRVSARASSFQFRDSDLSPAEIGGALKVAALLGGSVRKAGPRVRITVQLVRVADGSCLWAESYDRTLEDIFAVQDDIARSVAKELRTTLLGEAADSAASRELDAEMARATRGRGTDAEAHRLYLLSRHLLGRWTRDDTARAIGHLREALELDPEFALAWTELARAYTFEAGQGWVPASQGYERAKRAVKRALSLEPDLAEAHAVLESIQTYHDWDWRGAARSIRRALELAPGTSEVLWRAGSAAWTQGRFEESIALYRRAVEQDPLSSGAYHGLARACHSAGRLAEAEVASRRALELAPERVSTRALLGLVLLDQGRTEEALDEILREPDDSWRLFGTCLAQLAAGRTAESDATLHAYVARFGETDAVQIAEIHAMRGEPDRAFEWLERARALRDGGLSGAKSSPWLRNLHADPRWRRFLAEMRFED